MNVINEQTINESDILDILIKKHPDISGTALKWEFYHFIKENSLIRIGRKKYAKNARIYDYYYQSNLTSLIDKYLSKVFPNIKIVLWESKQLNEWLNLLMNVNIIYIEVEKEYVDYVFSTLNEAYGNKYLILLNPNAEDTSRYLRDNLVIVKTLFSKSPINKTNKKIKLEKLIVDVVNNEISLDTRGIEDIVLGIKNNYDIDFDKTLSYASRRRIKDKLIEIWGESNND